MNTIRLPVEMQDADGFVFSREMYRSYYDGAIAFPETPEARASARAIQAAFDAGQVESVELVVTLKREP